MVVLTMLRPMAMLLVVIILIVLTVQLQRDVLVEVTVTDAGCLRLILLGEERDDRDREAHALIVRVDTNSVANIRRVLGHRRDGEGIRVDLKGVLGTHLGAGVLGHDGGFRVVNAVVRGFAIVAGFVVSNVDSCDAVTVDGRGKRQGRGKEDLSYVG